MNVRTELLALDNAVLEDEITTGITEEETIKEFKDIFENSGNEKKPCMSESEVSQRMGENEIEAKRILEMKRKLKNDPNFNDAYWLKGHPDFDKWIPIIEEHQGDILPVDLIKRKRLVHK